MESRTKKSFLNAKVNLIFYFLTLLISFFSRKIFLNFLGNDFVGLTTTLQNILGFLNLAELGIGTAIGYVLYKPLFEHNQLKINEIISVMGYLYQKIGIFILIVGILISFFLPIIFPSDSTSFNICLIYFGYYSFLFSSLIGYFINYKQNLLGADQKNYVVTAYFQGLTILKTLIQMLSAYYTQSFYLWISFEFTFGIIYSIILNWKINQTYPWLKSEVSLGKTVLHKYPEVITYIKQLFIHKLTGTIQYQSAPILIYSFVSLGAVAMYGNYMMLMTKINQLLRNVLDGTNAGIGNLIAEGNNSKIYQTYWELMSFRIWFVIVSSFILYKLIPPFIVLWLGKDYILSNSILVLLIFNYIIIGIIRGNTDQFILGYGLFGDVWASVIETVLFILFAIIGGFYYGLVGIVFASTISLLISIVIWKPYYLFSRGFKQSVLSYWIKIFIYVICACVSFFISNSIINQFESPLNWETLFISSIVYTLVIAIISFILLYIFTIETRRFSKRLYTILIQNR